MFQCIRRFKTVSWVAMLAAFSASLDGYRKKYPDLTAGYYSTNRALKKSISMAASFPTRASFGKWQLLAPASSKENTSLHGEVSNQQVKQLVRLYAITLSNTLHPISHCQISFSNTQQKGSVAKSPSTSSGSISSSVSSLRLSRQNGNTGSLPNSSPAWVSVCFNQRCLYTYPRSHPHSCEVSSSTHTVCESANSHLGAFLETHDF